MDWPACKLQVCNLDLSKFAQAELQKVNNYSKIYDNFDIQRQVEHFEYEIIHT